MALGVKGMVVSWKMVLLHHRLGVGIAEWLIPEK